MPHSVLDAIKMGVWDFEPKNAAPREYSSTEAIPGSNEKVDVLADRVEQGLPLWHPKDRRSYSEREQEL